MSISLVLGEKALNGKNGKHKILIGLGVRNKKLGEKMGVAQDIFKDDRRFRIELEELTICTGRSVDVKSGH